MWLGPRSRPRTINRFPAPSSGGGSELTALQGWTHAHLHGALVTLRPRDQRGGMFPGAVKDRVFVGSHSSPAAGPVGAWALGFLVHPMVCPLRQTDG